MSHRIDEPIAHAQLPTAQAQLPSEGGGLLQTLFLGGVLSEIDYYFAQVLAGLEPTESPLVLVAAALASRAVQAGHVCLDLETFGATPVLNQHEEVVQLSWPEQREWSRLLEASRLVHSVSRCEDLSPDAEVRPLVLEAKRRLYLQRYADYQTRLLRALQKRTGAGCQVDEALLKRGIDRYFGAVGENTDYQRVAAALAARSLFSVISGGPGTGKTTTVSKLLLLLQEQQLVNNEQPLRIALLAPTGKAAQRLSESIERSLTELAAALAVPAELRSSLPREASTIHRALGFRRRSPTQFYHHQGRPIHADVVLVDEASMVDLALMTKLVEAVPDHARLILLGDKDQLASVEAGAILGDIFNSDVPRSYTPATQSFLERATGHHLVSPAAPDPGRPGGTLARIVDHTIQLTRSYRYQASSALGHLARAIQEGDASGAVQALSDPTSELKWLRTEGASYAETIASFEAEILGGYAEYLRAISLRERLALFARYRFLTPHRRGGIGSVMLNAIAEQKMRLLLGAPSHGDFYAGRPILITENDYPMGLFNGDTGIIDWNEERTRLVAYFEQPEGVRAVQTSRLPAFEPVFVMTVHKSQGSEFDRIGLMLPPERSPVFTRELLYTAVTRARQGVTLIGTQASIVAGLSTRVSRASGLRDALWR